MFESRGPIEIKGVGQQETWFLIGSGRTAVDGTEAAAECSAYTVGPPSGMKRALIRWKSWSRTLL